MPRALSNAQFWKKLGNGEFFSDEFLRIGKAGKRVHIQASYNPIFDADRQGLQGCQVRHRRDRARQQCDVTVERARALGRWRPDFPHRRPLPTRARTFAGQFQHRKQGAVRGHAVGFRNARAISSGSEEIRNAADDPWPSGPRTRRHRSRETAAALEEITKTVAASSERADEAGQLVAKTKRDAETSGQVVDKAVIAMAEIESSSKAITNIINVIDDIAFQTNLLGAQRRCGSGASRGSWSRLLPLSPRKCANSPSEPRRPPREIKGLITASGDQVKSGVALVGGEPARRWPALSSRSS